MIRITVFTIAIVSTIATVRTPPTFFTISICSTPATRIAIIIKNTTIVTIIVITAIITHNIYNAYIYSITNLLKHYATSL